MNRILLSTLAAVMLSIAGCSNSKPPIAKVDRISDFVETSPELADARAKADGAPAKKAATSESRTPLIGKTRAIETWLLPDGGDTQVINVHATKRGKQWAVTEYSISRIPARASETTYK